MDGFLVDAERVLRSWNNICDVCVYWNNEVREYDKHVGDIGAKVDSGGGLIIVWDMTVDRPCNNAIARDSATNIERITLLNLITLSLPATAQTLGCLPLLRKDWAGLTPDVR